jgi:hypothetical protein
MFAEGFSNEQYARLMLSNGVPTSTFTVIGFLALIVMRRLMFTESGSANKSWDASAGAGFLT